MPPKAAAARGGEGRDPRLDRRRGGVGDRPDRPVPGDDRAPGRPRLVVAPAGRRPELPRSARGLGPDAGRSLRPREARGEGAGARARGRPPDLDPPRLLRPHRPPADARGGRRLPRDDPRDAYERLVDRLLASPQFGVRWARWWLDLARFGESNGFEYDEFRPHAWRYRDWVVDALNRDLPYDDFARLQLAGDAVRPDDPRASRRPASSSPAPTTPSARTSTAGR